MMLRGALAARAFDVNVDREGVLWLSAELDMHATDAFAEAAESASHRAGRRRDRRSVEARVPRLFRHQGDPAIGTSDRRVVLRRPAPRVRKVLDLTGIIGREGIPLADD